MGPAALGTFVAACTEVRAHPAVPEIRLHLAPDPMALWERVEEAMGRGQLEAPFWATAWAGGLALARYVLDHPETVAGRDVVDVATGSGLVAIAAALAGARSVAAYDTDELAVAAAAANAARNGVLVRVGRAHVRNVAAPAGAVVTAGDVFYDRDISSAMLEPLGALARAGATVLVGDPFRTFLPLDRIEPLATFDVSVDVAVESVATKAVVVARFS